MKNKTPIENISLSFTCDKDWDKMVPCSSGRHCTDCDSTVLDFSDKSLQELQDALRSEGKVCGRFHKSQVAKPYHKNTSSLKRIAASILMALGLSAFGRELHAQSISCNDTSHDHDENQTEMAFGMIVETMPVYKYGGEKGLVNFIQKNLVHPKNKSLNGFDIASFLIDTTGTVTEPRVMKGLSSEADKEALRVVKLLKFEPGTQSGKRIPIRYTLPIRFGDARGNNKD